MAEGQITPVACPVCGARFSARLETIIDAGSDPSGKARLLRGELNVARCPQCGHTGIMTAPLLYHDGEKQLAFVLMPNELNMSHEEQQRFIGNLTNSLMNSLPPAQRKAYLLQPRMFLAMPGMVDAILEADGITREMRQAQEERAHLIERFLETGSEEEIRNLARENKDKLDRDFFMLLTAYAQEAHARSSSENLAEALLGLRAILARVVEGGQEILAEVDAALGLGETITREELLGRLRDAPDDKAFDGLVAMARPLLDYTFFQDVTAEIDRAVSEGRDDEAASLRNLRSRILDSVDKLDEQSRAAMEKAAALLNGLLRAEDRQSYIKEHIEEFDDPFFMVLSANMQHAREEKREDMAKALQVAGDEVIAEMRKAMPPEVRIINDLFLAEHPDGTRRIILQNKTAFTPAFMEMLEQLIHRLHADGHDAIAGHMEKVVSQIEMLVEGLADT